MDCANPKCLGNYNFDHIAFYAVKRFVEGHATIDLLKSAKTRREKEEIALVSMLDMDDTHLRELNLVCKKAENCKSLHCREQLRQVIADALLKRKPVKCDV